MVSPEDNNSGRDENGRFKKGTPGGPGGSKRRAETRRAVEEAVSPEHLKAIMRKLTHESIQKGNTKAADIVLKYAVGLPAGATKEPEPLDLPIPDLNSPAACAKAAEVVVSAINQGAVHSDTANVMLGGIKDCSQLLPSTNTESTSSDGSVAGHAIPYKLMRLRFHRFMRVGQLPDDPWEAVAVIERVKAGFYLPDEDAVDAAESFGDGFLQRHREPAEVMDELFDEAVRAPVEIRVFARAALIDLARKGADLTGNPLKGMVLPTHGNVGTTLLGYQEPIARRPYVAQSRRLLARMDAIRQRVPTERQESDEWFQRAREAGTYFEHTGELPADDLMLEVILTAQEWATLARHSQREDVRDLLRLFDEAARSTGEQRANAIAQLQEMAKAGRLMAPSLLAS